MSSQEVEVLEVIPAARPVEVEVIGGDSLPPVVTVPAISQRVLTKPGLAGDIDRLKLYASSSDWFARASLAMQVMCGITLRDIKRVSPYTQGRKALPGKKPHDAGFSENGPEMGISVASDPFAGFSTWEAFLKGTAGISADTAGRWMAMAEAALPRLRKLDGWGDMIQSLLDRPISNLAPEEVEMLSKAVAKITDGRTQLDFLVELGIVKRPGNPALGGNTGGRPAASGVIDEEAIKRAAIEDWATVERGILGGGMGFTVLTDAAIEAQIGLLARAVSVRREWIASPASARNPQTIKTLGKTLA